ncbi:chemotaxis response regulator protein-glutamate methylesterase [Ectothiorhodospiraceae bacterium BW-2]|nr:chemotaxis response regulator protein-glutamate methylesterase [Ectothiorhodospiraceae bacterium BW-2]
MIKVLIVDDSAVVRQVLTEQLQKSPGIHLIGSARDPIFAMKAMEREWPDVIVLDIEMPRMDGITFLKKIMAEHPTPVVICSTLTERGAKVTMEAMASGAVEIITKPKAGLRGFLEESGHTVVNAVKNASRAAVGKMRFSPPSATAQPLLVTAKLSADAVIQPATRPMHETTDRVIAIGTSTGGTQALEQLLTQLPRTVPGIVIVQHMPEHFTSAFAARLDSVCQIQVKEAVSGDRVMPGLALVANGGKHMLLRRSGAQYRVEVKDGPLVSRHRPSVDVLFRSVANSAGKNAIGIIMTGMGDDGARGMKEMHDAGAYTVAQDEASCVVYGMPKEAVKLGGVDIQLPLNRLPELIIKGHA